jgi:hypothetical protein
MPARRRKHRDGSARTSQRRRHDRWRQHQSPQHKTCNQAGEQTCVRNDYTGENKHADTNDATGKQTNDVNGQLINRNHKPEHSGSNRAGNHVVENRGR